MRKGGGGGGSKSEAVRKGRDGVRDGDGDGDGDSDGDGDGAVYSQYENDRVCSEDLDCPFAVLQCLVSYIFEDLVEYGPTPATAPLRRSVAGSNVTRTPPMSPNYRLRNCAGGLTCPTGMVCQTIPIAFIEYKERFDNAKRAHSIVDDRPPPQVEQ